MTDILEKSPNHITLHFDVPEHSIPYYQFVDCVNGTELILKNLNQQLFKSSSDIEIQILPSEEGGLKIKIAAYLLLPFVTVAIDDIRLGIIKSLVGYSPSEYIISLLADGKKSESKELTLDENSKNLILMKCAVSILQNNDAKLMEAGITESSYRDALEGKNKFFNSCIKNEAVRAVGFDDSYNFSVPRKNFSEHVIELSDTEIVEEVQTIDSQGFFSDTLNIEIFAASSRKHPSSKWRAVFLVSLIQLVLIYKMITSGMLWRTLKFVFLPTYKIKLQYNVFLKKAEKK